MTVRAWIIAGLVAWSSAAHAGEQAAAAAEGEWTMPAKDYASTRFSTLTEITAANARQLKLAFTFDTGINKGQEAAPLVVGTTMYIVTPFPNILYALDLTKPTATVKWTFEPKPEPRAQGVACCDVVNRGAVHSNGLVFFNTLDGQTLAVDAATGRMVWRTKLADINLGETITMAPLVVKDKVLVGNSGGEYGVRGWIAALDAATGKLLWQAFSTGPDAEVLIGPEFKPHYAQDQGKDLGVTTWPPDAWRMGGGNVWGWISYDPELNLIYHGTGNPGPWAHTMRPGDNKWTAGIFARDADSGQARWFYQWSPHDVFDHDGINENVLVELPWKGQDRKLLIRPERNGYLYVLDRETGEVLSAKPFHTITATKGVDLKSGRSIYEPSKIPQPNKMIRDICPAAPGAKDWNPSAYSPLTRTLYIPHSNLCMDHTEMEANYIAGTPYVGAEVKMKPGPGGHRGAFTAWDILAEKPKWQIKENFPVWSGALVTAGGVAFYGTMDGWFKAVELETGKLLWQYKTSSGIIGQPTTYLGPDGRQYVAILAGVGGWSGAIVVNELDARDTTAALGFVGAMGDLPQATKPGGMLYVFGLP